MASSATASTWSEIGVREVIARIRAVMRRTRPRTPAGTPDGGPDRYGTRLSNGVDSPTSVRWK